MLTARFIILLTAILVGGCRDLGPTTERDHVEMIQKQLGGEMEVTVAGGRADLVTKDIAWEVEFASNWKSSIGQALWYGLQTNKKAGIILIKRAEKENRYVIQLGSALQHGNLEEAVEVMVWPDDF